VCDLANDQISLNYRFVKNIAVSGKVVILNDFDEN
jgi:hypothetical protein